MPSTRFDNSYARLPDRFYKRMAPATVSAPKLVKLNLALAAELGLDPAWLASPEGVEVLAGNRVAEGSDPLAMAYAGHQFGNFSPQLGDGRALLLGEVVDIHGARRDIQLKGSGRTPFSRGGDGRAALGPMLREYVISEAIHALGIPSTRSLAVATTGEGVVREAILPGAVLTRVAASHIRVGTFQYFAARGDVEAIRLLADHARARHYPDAKDCRGFYEAVIARQAALVAQWLCVGFIHGVMNTDNVSIAGETIDYGPCAFMDAYNPETVFSSIDQMGRYAYARQPQIAGWNMARLGEALMPLFNEDQDKALAAANESLATYNPAFGAALVAGLRRKLGLFTEQESDGELAQSFLNALHTAGADFTNSFRALGDAAAGDDAALHAMFEDKAGIDAWLTTWRARTANETQDGEARRTAMNAVNPIYIPRNQRVEAALTAAENDDYGPFEELLQVLAKPYEARPQFAAYAEAGDSSNYRTFCGT
jgi:uncharacterized protein YdiU (UPF0061 family)